MHTHKADACGVCKIPSFERNNYFHGKTLSARDLLAEQRYFNEKRWLINRMVIGWGVVCGLDVSVDGDCLFVSPGLALDCCGREVVVCERLSVHVHTLSEQLSGASESAYERGGGIRWMLCLEYLECSVEPVASSASCEPHPREYNRTRDGYRLSFRRATDKCPEDQSDDCCPDADAVRTPIQQAIVERSRKCPACGECDCIVLATGSLLPPSQQYGRLKLEDDFWKYRRTVHTNRALADLFRCFHSGLPHITRVNWTPHPAYSVDGFLAALRDGLQVSFDRAMEVASVQTPHSCRLTIAVVHEESGCPTQILVPVRQIVYAGDTATYHFDAQCVEHELRRTCQKHRRPADVELVLHGSMIHDTAGRALDAELIRGLPTGNGVEGGEFIAFYRVEP